MSCTLKERKYYTVNVIYNKLPLQVANYHLHLIPFQDVILLLSFQGLVKNATGKFIICIHYYHRICEENQLHFSDIEEFVYISFRVYLWWSK